MKKWFLGILSVFFVLVLAACGGDDENTDNASADNGDKVFKIGGIPDQNVSDLNRRFQEIADYIGEKTGLTVEYVPSNDYAALVKAFERGEVHLAWFGGLTGVQARNAVEGAEAIAQRPRDAEFHSVFVAQKDLGLESIEDVKGLSFTFGSESSTSGHLMPRYYMMEAGIDPNADLDGDPNYSGSHDKTYKLVESGAFQAGALNEAVWESAVEEGKVDTSKVDVFYTTPSYYDYNWTINSVDEEFGEGTKDKVKEALLSVTSEQEAIVDLFQTDKFIETNNANYDMIRQVAEELGIIK
ncbi:putative selenate ABC transporter substrate-binding protein [Bacillaceae bacterium S4-13-56]